MNEISREAKNMRNEYQRAWNKKNAKKRKEYMRTYWERKACEAEKEGVNI